MTNASKLIVSGLIIAITGATYGLSSISPEERIIETIIAQNKAIEATNQAKVESWRENKTKCEQTASGSSQQILDQLSQCSKMEKPDLQTPVPLPDGNSGSIQQKISKISVECFNEKTDDEQFTCWLHGIEYKKYQRLEILKGHGSEKYFLQAKAAPASVKAEPPSKGYTQKHTLILTGSHDYRQYAHLHPGVAGWKNNNPSGLTWGVSNTLKGLWDMNGIDYKQGTARPKNEKGYYILFGSVEHGIRAKMISIRERWGNATVSHFLSGWGTDYIFLSFDKKKLIKDLSEQEFIELFINQLRKESPGYIDALVKDKILIVE